MQLSFLDEILKKRRLHPKKREIKIRKITKNGKMLGSNPRPGVRAASDISVQTIPLSQWRRVELHGERSIISQRSRAGVDKPGGFYRRFLLFATSDRVGVFRNRFQLRHPIFHEHLKSSKWKLTIFIFWHIFCDSLTNSSSVSTELFWTTTSFYVDGTLNTLAQFSCRNSNIFRPFAFWKFHVFCPKMPLPVHGEQQKYDRLIFTCGGIVQGKRQICTYGRLRDITDEKCTEEEFLCSGEEQ